MKTVAVAAELQISSIVSDRPPWDMVEVMGTKLVPQLGRLAVAMAVEPIRIQLRGKVFIPRADRFEVN